MESDKTYTGDVAYWGMWSTSLLSLLPGPLSPEVLVPVGVPSLSQIHPFVFGRNKKKLHKKVNVNIQ